MSSDHDKVEPTKKERDWLLPDSKSRNIRAGLYLVACPIGNMGDISLRALDTIAAADMVACEDTRVTGKLLKYYGLSKKMESYNDHSDGRQRDKVLDAALGGQIVVLMSDAGMPMISDPGYRLVNEARERGVYISSVPGANAPLTAMQLSGLPSDSFSFIGFLPNKKTARQEVLRRWADVPASLIAFETAPRLLKALADIDEVFGAREMCVARELTKLYEEARRGSARELIDYYQGEGQAKGEIVLVIAPPAAQDISESDLKAMLVEALKTHSTKDAAALVAQQSGAAKSALYALALEIGKDDQE